AAPTPAQARRPRHREGDAHQGDAARGLPGPGHLRAACRRLRAVGAVTAGAACPVEPIPLNPNPRTIIGRTTERPRPPRGAPANLAPREPASTRTRIGGTVMNRSG